MLYNFVASFYLYIYLLPQRYFTTISGMTAPTAYGWPLYYYLLRGQGNPVNHMRISTLYEEEMTRVLIYINSEVSDRLAISLGT